jgi:zinc/manganese transport system ATP-binding protein
VTEYDDASPAVALTGASLAFGQRTLWSGLDLSVAAGEFIAVLGPNGTGKTSLLRVLLGQLPLSAGEAKVGGYRVRRGNTNIGYIPQQKAMDESLPLRGRDLVGLGYDGHKWGLGFRNHKARAAAVDAVIDEVAAGSYADAPVGLMSGGEQQRLRVAQALVGDPKIMLCDEPLLSLDLRNQELVSALIGERRRARNIAVLFVTHEINPILPLVDRVLYLANGQFRIGTPDQVMTSETLTELYGTPVEVLRTRGRILVVGTGDSMDALGSGGGAHPAGEMCHPDDGHDDQGGAV